MPENTLPSPANNQSTASLSTVSSNATAASYTPLRSGKSPKNYEAALGALQSRYGTTGVTPSPKSTPSKRLPETDASPSMGLYSASSSTVIQPRESSSAASNPSTRGGADQKEKKSSKSSLLLNLLKGLARSLLHLLLGIDDQSTEGTRSREKGAKDQTSE